MSFALILLLGSSAAAALWVAVLFARGLASFIARRRHLRRTRHAAQPIHLTVQRRVDHTDALFELTLVHPKSKRLPGFLPGQHLLVATDAGRRAYSLAAWSARPRHYQLGIKRESHGAVSGWAWENLRPGSRVSVLPPRGDFLLRPCADERVLIAGGIGITPMRAMLHAALASRTCPRIALVYAARQRADLLWHDEFAALAQRTPALRYVPLLSAPDSAWTGATGRLDAARIMQWTHDPSRADFYLCAGSALMHALCEGLRAAGVSDTRIHWEAFGAALGMGGSGERIALENGGECVTAGEPSLLATLEANGQTLPSECRAGTCGQCRISLLEGKVRWLLQPGIALTEQEILPCCCVAEGDIRLRI